MENKVIKAGIIVESIKKLAPEADMQKGDNAGLQVGSIERAVKNVLVSLDVTPEVVEEALKNNVDMIISHHPIMLQSQKNLGTDNSRGRMLAVLLKNDITVYTAHTNLDVAINGVNAILGKKIGLTNVEVLDITSEEKCYKLVTCIPVMPEDYTTQIRTKLGDYGLTKETTGVGIVGLYSHVSDYAKATANFVPLEGTNPFIGEQGVLESVESDRFEMIIPESMLEKAVEILCEIHPYEEVEYDVYPILETRNPKGFGRIGNLTEAKKLSEVIENIKKALDVSTVRVVGDGSKIINRVAVCGGSGSNLIRKAYEKGADLFITGDISYQEGQLAKELGISLIDAGYWATKQPIVSIIKEHLDSDINKESEVIKVIESTTKTEPFAIF